MKAAATAGAVALTVAALTGCAWPPRAPEGATAAPQHWSGRLALHIDASPVQQFSAGFELSGDPAAGSLRLLSPFGQTLALAQWTPQGATLQHKGDTLSYPDTDTLTAALTGTPLPLPRLFDWLQGQATPLPGWDVDLSGHPDGRLLARRHHPLPAVQLRLVLD